MCGRGGGGGCGLDWWVAELDEAMESADQTYRPSY